MRFFGLYAQKVGMDHLMFNGRLIYATFLWISKPYLLNMKTHKRDGYNAILIGFGVDNGKHINNPQKNLWSRNDSQFCKFVKEFRMNEDDIMPDVLSADGTVVKGMRFDDMHASWTRGEIVNIEECFSTKSLVDVTGVSIGRGFSGVMTVHNFKGGPASHGSSKFHRQGGSTGGVCRRTGKTRKGRKMPRRYGGENITMQNLSVVCAEKLELYGQEGVMLGVYGGVPGKSNSWCCVYRKST